MGRCHTFFFEEGVNAVPPAAGSDMSSAALRSSALPTRDDMALTTPLCSLLDAIDLLQR